MVQTAVQFTSILREVNLDVLADEAHRAPRLLIIGPPVVGGDFAHEVLGPEFEHVTTIADIAPADGGAAFDLAILLWTGSNAASLREHVATCLQRGWPSLIASLTDLPAPADASTLPTILWSGAATANIDEARTDLVRAVPEARWTALGRYLPAVRLAASRELVVTTARVNAQFSGLSGAATLIPVIGSIIALGGDFLVLTKNQAIMLFKLAAVHGRDLDDRTKLYLEMASVLGAGLIWRTLARQLISLTPGPIGLLPRIGIAYGGTMAIGMAAHFYYHEGRLPDRADLSQLKSRAATMMQSIRRHEDSSAAPVDATIVRELPMDREDTSKAS